MSLIVNGTEITDLIVIDKQGNRVEIEKMQDQLGNILFEKATAPKIFIVPFKDGGTACYTYQSSGTAVAGTSYYQYNIDTCLFDEVSIAEGGDITGYFTGSMDGASYYIVVNTRGYANNGANILGLSTVTIPGEFNGLPVRGICPSAFYGDTNVTKIVIQEGVEMIGEDAFNGCTNLTEISIPNSASTIYADAFWNTALINNESNWTGDCLYLNNKLISIKSTATSITIPANVTTVAHFCAEGCKNLATVNFNATKLMTPQNVTLINNYKYPGIGASVTTPSLKGIDTLGLFSWEDANASDNIGTVVMATLNIGSNVYSLPSTILSAGCQQDGGSGTDILRGGFTLTPNFLENTNITELQPFSLVYPLVSNITSESNPLVIPSKITSVMPYACAGGVSAYYNFSHFRVDCNVLSEGMFADQSTLTSTVKSIVLNGRPTEIPKDCFKSLESLTSMVIPSSVAKIGDSCFNSCNGITTLTFNQPSGMAVQMPTAGSSTGAFYYKSARAVKIYTDNETIKNYAWATDNVTATLYHLDGSAW